MEIWATEAEATAAFANYISAMLSLAKCESDQEGISTDLSLFLDEVAMCLRAWKPNSALTTGPEYQGISGHLYKLDFTIDQDAVLAITPHHASVSSAAKKLLDIRAVEAYSRLRIIVVVNDRQERDAARREGLVLESVASVMMMSTLERRAGLSNADAS